MLQIMASMKVRDIIDIIIVAVMTYCLIIFMLKTEAYQLMTGIGALIGLYMVAQTAGFKTLSFYMNALFRIGYVAVIVIFSPELRKLLEKFGQSQLSPVSIRFRLKKTRNNEIIKKLQNQTEIICDTVYEMSSQKIGALIVLENFISLQDIYSTGTEIDSKISSGLLRTIFYEGTPLHDGAVIIKDGVLKYAGCVLPLSKTQKIKKDLGTRHRAALGISEVADCIVVVVSEETGTVSVAQNGVLKRNLARTDLYQIINDCFVTPLIEITQSNAEKGE